MTIEQREAAFVEWLKSVPNKVGDKPMLDGGAKDYRSHLRNFRNKFDFVDMDAINAPQTLFSFVDPTEFNAFYMTLRSLPQFAIQESRDHKGLRTAMERYLEFLRSGDRS